MEAGSNLEPSNTVRCSNEPARTFRKRKIEYHLWCCHCSRDCWDHMSIYAHFHVKRWSENTTHRLVQWFAYRRPVIVDISLESSYFVFSRRCFGYYYIFFTSCFGHPVWTLIISQQLENEESWWLPIDQVAATQAEALTVLSRIEAVSAFGFGCQKWWNGGVNPSITCFCWSIKLFSGPLPLTWAFSPLFVVLSSTYTLTDQHVHPSMHLTNDSFLDHVVWWHIQSLNKCQLSSLAL